MAAGSAGLALVVLASAVLVSAPSSVPPTASPAATTAQGTTTTASEGPSATPSTRPGWSAEPSSTPYVPPSDDPDPSPTPAATLIPGARQARVVLRVDCTNYVMHGEEPSSYGVSAVHGDRIYMACGTMTDVRLAAVVASTGHIARWYSFGVPDFRGKPFVYDAGFWYSNSSMNIMCVAYCPIDDPWVARADPNTGRQTLKIEGWHLFGGGLGYVWAAPAVAAHASTLLKIDPVTMSNSTIPWTYGDPHVGCDSLWGFAWSEARGTTAITRVDPTSGAPLSSFVEKGRVFEPHAISGGCWAKVELVVAEGNLVSRLIRLGPAGVESRSSVYRESIAFAGESAWFLNTTCDPQECFTHLQRADLETLKPTGTLWVLPDSYESIEGIGGYVWASNYVGILRTNIPTGEPVTTPTPGASEPAA